jgi:uncharacterized damage-inducible protein DinB
MSIPFIVNQLAAYNTWANVQIIQWLQKEDDKILTQKVPSSFSTLKSTFLHIWNAERFWHSFLEKKPHEKFSLEYDGDSKAFFESIHQQSHQFENFVQSLPDHLLEEEFKIDTPWLKGKQPCFTFIQHVVNHSTYHRGQLITMGRSLGLINPPNTDYTLFAMKFFKAN